MEQKTLGLYIHIPFCKRKCSYCDFPSYAGMEALWDAYADAVVKELIMKAEAFKGTLVKTVFIGGGTPSLIPYQYIERMMKAAYSYYQIENGCEATLEANPGTLTDEKLEAYRKIGLNRLSLGLQAGQDYLLAKLGRIHSFDDFESAVKLAQKHAIYNINADIIFGIPDQSLDDWKDTIARILPLNLTHLSCYSLKIEEGTPFGDMKEKGLLCEVEDEVDRDMYHYAVDRLNQAGFTQYEISNFAKPHAQCQHNMNYWESGEYIGIGAGAHSFFQDRRYANTPEVESYMKGINLRAPVLSEEYVITPKERLSEKMVLGLRLNRGVNLAGLSEEFGVNLEEKYKEKIEKLFRWKLVERSGSVLKLTKRGLDLANSVFIEFI